MCRNVLLYIFLNVTYHTGVKHPLWTAPPFSRFYEHCGPRNTAAWNGSLVFAPVLDDFADLKLNVQFSHFFSFFLLFSPFFSFFLCSNQKVLALAKPIFLPCFRINTRPRKTPSMHFNPPSALRLLWPPTSVSSSSALVKSWTLIRI